MNTVNMAKWSLLTDFLNGIEKQVTLTWPELVEIVGEMPASATEYPAWWTSGHSHFNAWTSAGFDFTNLQRGSQVTFYRVGKGDLDAARRAPKPSAKPAPVEGEIIYEKLPPPDLILISCVSTKIAEPAMARDLYVSDLFRKERTYAERSGVSWYILSGEHNLVRPDQWLAPYDCYLPKKTAAYRRAWGEQVVISLVEAEGPLQGKIIEIHAAIPYIAAIRKGLQSHGAIITEPWRGIGGIGDIKHWYAEILSRGPE